MITFVALALSGCRFYDGPRNGEVGSCAEGIRYTEGGPQSVVLGAGDWGDPSRPMGSCDQGWSREQAVLWTPTQTGPVEVTVTTSGAAVGLAVVSPCPEIDVWACGSGGGAFVVEFAAVAGEPVTFVVQGYEDEEVGLEIRELTSTIDTGMPEDTDVERRQCGTAPPEVYGLQVFNASTPGIPSVGLSFTMEDPDGALHSVFPFLVVDPVVDGVLDPAALTYGFADPITDFGEACVA